ncbi:hypothetical protein NDU88_005496 [Pleurodeles waltl]|uniref:Uncharacterized protein n=1 Tax=Pleurodeles waltl TaxID=8319 RepID=A0AAV7L9L9_PLEWA|nr:hypothetical protein NDU88_005496 [Pleurodeles waltl]
MGGGTTPHTPLEQAPVKLRSREATPPSPIRGAPAQTPRSPGPPSRPGPPGQVPLFSLETSRGRDHRHSGRAVAPSHPAVRRPEVGESLAEPHPIGSPAPGAFGFGRHRRKPRSG